jgi:PAP2 superfamily
VPPPPAKVHRLSWWRELLLTAGFYAAYSAVRDAHGLATIKSGYAQALANGRRVMSAEKTVHLGWEHGIQKAALHVTWLVRAANVFYGSAHFLVTTIVLVWLFLFHKDHYQRWRTALAVATAIALVGFLLFPVLPPRLLPSSYGFTDTLHSLGGLWSFNSGVIEHISDPFAAMPSLHLCWATWCAAALLPVLRHRWSRVLAVSYPLVTATVVVVTGNHYVLDLVGGVACFALGMALTAIPRRAVHRSAVRANADPLRAAA